MKSSREDAKDAEFLFEMLVLILYDTFNHQNLSGPINSFQITTLRLCASASDFCK